MKAPALKNPKPTPDTHRKAIRLAKRFAVNYGNAHIAINTLYMEEACRKGDNVGYRAAAGSISCEAMRTIEEFASKRLQGLEDVRASWLRHVGKLLTAVAESMAQS